MLAWEHFGSVDGVQLHPDVEDVLHIEDDEDGLFDEPDWTLDGFQPSVSDNLSLSMRSTFDDMKMVCCTWYQGSDGRSWWSFPHG